MTKAANARENRIIRTQPLDPDHDGIKAFTSSSSPNFRNRRERIDRHTPYPTRNSGTSSSRYRYRYWANNNIR